MSGRRRPRFTLLVRFGLVSALAFAALATILARDTTAGIRAEALTEARTIATLTANLRLAPMLTRHDLSRGMAPAKRARLGSALSEALTSTHVVRAKLWNRDRRVIYSDDPKLVGHRFNVDDDLDYMNRTGMHFIGLINHRYGLEIDPAIAVGKSRTAPADGRVARTEDA